MAVSRRRINIRDSEHNSLRLLVNATLGYNLDYALTYPDIGLAVFIFNHYFHSSFDHELELDLRVYMPKRLLLS